MRHWKRQAVVKWFREQQAQGLPANDLQEVSQVLRRVLPVLGLAQARAPRAKEQDSALRQGWGICGTRFLTELRRKNYAPNTVGCYGNWVRRFYRRWKDRDPRQLSGREMEVFLNELTLEQRLSPKTRNQALNALVMFYRMALDREPGDMDLIKAQCRARSKKRLPVVLSEDEASKVLSELKGPAQTMAALMVGSGLRRGEVVSLRVQDLDLERRTITVRRAKGDKDRVTLLPEALVPVLEEQVKEARRVHEADLALGGGEAVLPDALSRKKPKEAWRFRWQWVFPGRRLLHRSNGSRYRHHFHDQALGPAQEQIPNDLLAFLLRTCVGTLLMELAPLRSIPPWVKEDHLRISSGFVPAPDLRKCHHGRE
ncbi:MAG: phage integrase N-terminal SAM-like domain-containing protein [Verrucomicrobiota bacterium]